jgi:nickel/cobalt exporter
MDISSRSPRLFCFRAFLVFTVCFSLLRPAAAHPMGNFSINHYARFEAQARQITLRYVLDFAELPTVTEREAMGASGNGPVPEAVSQAYLRGKALTLRDGLTLTIDGNPASLSVTPVTVELRPGAGDLSTMRLVLDLAAPLPAARTGAMVQVAYRDNNYAERTGWKEIVVVGGAGTALPTSSVSGSDVSKELTVYPANPTLAPPQQTEATFTVAPGGVASASPPVIASPQPQASNTHTPQDAFTQAIARKQLTPGVMLLGLLIAFVFGSFHALSPGHGKTMVAAYLVGSRGTARHAVSLGVIVTVTHTLGVFALGLVTLFASKYVVPEKLYPILSVVSGLAVFGVGVWLLTSRLRGIADDHGHAHDHSHTHDHEHPHTHDHDPDHAHGPDEIHLHLADHDHTHDHDHSHTHDADGGHSHGFGHHHHHVPDGPITARSLLALGISGGIVPCPSALVVLLSAVALHRIAYGMALITAFSVGLASVLIIIGLMVVSTRHWFERFPASEGLLRRLPVASAAAITLIGIMLVIRAVTQGV